MSVRHRYRMLLVLMCALVVFAVQPAPAAQPSDNPRQSPRALISKLHDTLLDVMKRATALGYQGRYQVLAPVLSRDYDFPAIAPVLLASHWTQLNDRQQQHFIATFRKLTIATYAARFDRYSGERFEITDVSDAVRGRKMVSSRLIGGGETHQFNYLLHQRDGHWRIMNVIVDGVSDLALKRSQYSSVIGKQGFDALIQALDEQIAGAGKPG